MALRKDRQTGWTSQPTRSVTRLGSGKCPPCLTRKLAPQLLDQPGVGPHAAAQLTLSWSQQGRITSEAAFARFAGAAPIPASSGQTIRYRLDRSGDRKLNRALHMILVTRKRSHPARAC